MLALYICNQIWNDNVIFGWPYLCGHFVPSVDASCEADLYKDLARCEILNSPISSVILVDPGLGQSADVTNKGATEHVRAVQWLCWEATRVPPAELHECMTPLLLPNKEDF